MLRNVSQTNAQRQAAWRKRRQEELQKLRESPQDVRTSGISNAVRHSLREEMLQAYTHWQTTDPRRLQAAAVNLAGWFNLLLFGDEHAL